jgi:hypothetical protein
MEAVPYRGEQQTLLMNFETGIFATLFSLSQKLIDSIPLNDQNTFCHGIPKRKTGIIPYIVGI